jgi:Fe2+ transport system protein B
MTRCVRIAARRLTSRPRALRDEIFEDAAEMTKGAREQAGKLGQELFAKISNWINPEDVEKLKQKAQEVGKKGSEKAREFANRDEVKQAADRARELGEEAMHRAQRYVDDERQKYEKADDQGRQMLLLKWGGIVGALVILYLLFAPGGCLYPAPPRLRHA